MTTEPKPAAALTAERIRRGRAALVGSAPPDGAPAFLSSPATGGGMRFWRRAGLFGLVYVGALLAFAAALDMLPMPGR